MVATQPRKRATAYLIGEVVFRPTVGDDGRPDPVGLIMLEQAFSNMTRDDRGHAMQVITLAILMGCIEPCFASPIYDLLENQQIVH